MAVSIFPGNFRIGVRNLALADYPERPPLTDLDPKFQLMVLLDGFQSFAINGEIFEMDARRAPVAFVMRLVRRADLQFLHAYGTPFRKIALATPHDWLALLSSEATAPWSETTTPGLSTHIWQPGKQIVRLSTQILNPPPSQVAVQTELFRVSRGLELIRRVLAEASTTPTQHGVASADPVAEKIRLYMLKHLDQTLTLERMELDLGMNRRSIQRHFKAGTGQTISDFLRQQRLEKARRALSEDGFTVAQAAHIAGYASPENFATAFRHAFGLTPHKLRNSAI
ncbi:helix-turn-helix domain-containing protein [Celeribacter sp.]|uniref:AraC family transcriptional regulator n=1 Tax=Celeribacter sp. TaxID=1890673 RepID=UPI003A944AC2